MVTDRVYRVCVIIYEREFGTEERMHLHGYIE